VNVIDGPTAPPLAVTLTREEYDRVKRDIEVTFDYHRMMRMMSRMFDPDKLSAEEIEELRREWQHFDREYGG
jgi:hypothetical protein